MSMQLVLMNCLKDKKYGDALSACNSLLARFPTDAMALECKTLLTEKAELAEMPTDGEEESEEGEGWNPSDLGPPRVSGGFLAIVASLWGSCSTLVLIHFVMANMMPKRCQKEVQLGAQIVKQMIEHEVLKASPKHRSQKG